MSNFGTAKIAVDSELYWKAKSTVRSDRTNRFCSASRNSDGGSKLKDTEDRRAVHFRAMLRKSSSAKPELHLITPLSMLTQIVLREFEIKFALDR